MTAHHVASNELVNGMFEQTTQQAACVQICLFIRALYAMNS